MSNENVLRGTTVRWRTLDAGQQTTCEGQQVNIGRQMADIRSSRQRQIS